MFVCLSVCPFIRVFYQQAHFILVWKLGAAERAVLPAPRLPGLGQGRVHSRVLDIQQGANSQVNNMVPTVAISYVSHGYNLFPTVTICFSRLQFVSYDYNMVPTVTICFFRLQFVSHGYNLFLMVTICFYLLQFVSHGYIISLTVALYL